MDSREEFVNTIRDYYINISAGKIPIDMLNELSEVITDYYYEQYGRFGKQYPKSIKRYSTFQLKDLDHPTTFEMAIKYFKNKIGENYKEYSGLLLNMNEEELIKFEKNREDFYKMW